jgi:hypothetical protein
VQVSRKTMMRAIEAGELEAGQLDVAWSDKHPCKSQEADALTRTEDPFITS